MSSPINFLIGRGEMLTSDISGPRRPIKKATVYEFSEAKQKLGPQFTKTAEDLNSLPEDACPQDFGVALLTLNPSYIAKSYFPTAMLRAVGLESVGSRTVFHTPPKWTRKGTPTECSTTELFIAGKRKIFQGINQWIETVEQGSSEAQDITHIEKFSSYAPENRIRFYGTEPEGFFEIGLHKLSTGDSSFIHDGFTKYANQVAVEIYADLRFDAGNLWFIPVKGTCENVKKLATFVFVRVIRPMPKLRRIQRMEHDSTVVACNLPTEQPLSSEPRVAILDGGLPKQHPITPWLHSYRLLDSTAQDFEGGPMHGLAVTSAFLFGPIQPNGVAQRPFAYVDHLRVWDHEIRKEDPLQLYRTLGFIEQVLLSRQYEFINLSLGPDLPIEDTDVHAWTAVIDDLLSDGNTFMTIAIGNNGAKDRSSGNARVQVPSDCVNAVAVGASNDTELGWNRATYSAIGPGRRPGVVKPDLMAFGGDASTKYFHVITNSTNPRLVPLSGTSFAAPFLLRTAVGIRAILGSALSPLAIKALLVHSASNSSGHYKLEVGWGKTPEDPMPIITCPSGVARIVYQGELKPGKYLRAFLPIPESQLTGDVLIKATFCYASPIDPQDAAAYTQAGLEVFFRPNSHRVKDGKKNAETKGFFDMNKYSTEDERRSDKGKWETVLHGEKRMRGSSLNTPMFDIHYIAREAGGPGKNANKIPYALIITIEAPKHLNLYNDILRTYTSLLIPIQPQVSIPVRV